MARTLAEIEQVMLDAKAADANLDVLDSASNLAIWRLWIKVVAFGHWTLEKLWDGMIATLKELAQSAQAGTDKWYADRMLEFQYGHALVEQDGKLVYLVDDPSARIIKKVATVTNSDGVLLIKVAKENAGSFIKLTDIEKTAANTYVIQKKFAGTKHLLISEDADVVKIVGLKVYYDGKLLKADVQSAVESAILSYLKNIYFNGFFSLNKFRDAIEAVPGVINGPDINGVWIKPAGGSYTAVLRDYNPLSGHFTIDPAFPLNDPTVIEYIPVA